ncbi:CAF17-like 4Fe-4S cluster assembly/insertion protein YgfZ [Oecophyllibacter saccharovorans]|uniref:CAF17-like 4Fe-4S cluster assembly/insertion protein YgfZ n=1 Tax=Oecophyllibacter saccharovorans TaxID=2558360 RepID=UPI00116E8742|nr:folate-binding protein YgfZ [Oecophyllibacter saccharovorans]TPW34739.1 folate-binding protein [Oecophyllibacter saccharovorans]
MRLMMNRNHLSPPFLPHPDRSVLSISGGDRIAFLQGLITADLKGERPASAGRASAAVPHQTGDWAPVAATPCNWSALLTPQGRIEALFFVFSTPDALLIDVPASVAQALQQRLQRFRLRADVVLAMTDLQVITGLAELSPQSGHCLFPATALPALQAIAPDPRTPQAGLRALVSPDFPANLTTPDRPPETWQSRRLKLGLPEWEDIEPGRTLALEADLDCLGGVSWTKGCYMGQEVTARTHYRGLLKRRLMPVELDEGEFPTLPENLPLVLDGREVGEVRSRLGKRGIALLHRTAWGNETLKLADGRNVRSPWPAWLPDFSPASSDAAPAGVPTP